MRLIDANALDETFEIGPDCEDCKIGRENCDQDANLSIFEICGIIAEQKTVDAVEVVRCKDCIHSRCGSDGIECQMHYRPTKEQDFCSYGERREVTE